MCGIAGSLRLTGDAPAAIGPMLNALKHRGPDGVAEWSDEDCALGQRRLAIIDLSDAGQAPLSNEDGSVWVTFNGEIYNFQALRRELEALGHTFRGDSDTEVIVHAYDEWGTASVERFRGMFAFALWDKEKRRLFLARDRVGKKPLFYAFVEGALFFSSEIQGLLTLPQLSREVDLRAVQSYLSWGYIPAPRTGFVGVHKLPPAHWLTVEIGPPSRNELREYWSLSYEPKVEAADEEQAAALRDALTEAVRLRMISDVPLGAFLSGGIDSSIVVGLMAQLSSSRIQTFSIGFEDADYNELQHARRVATRLGTDHHEEMVRPNALDIVPALVRHYGEPFADSSAIPTFCVSQVARKRVTVALNGDGGDESFGGYDRYGANLAAARIGKVPGLGYAARLARAVRSSKDVHDPFKRAERFLALAGQPEAHRYAGWMSYFDDRDKERLCTAQFLQDISPTSTAQWFEEMFASSDCDHPIDAAMSVDVRSYLPYDLLVKVDIASMANSLEARSPFLDHEVMQFAARLPANLKRQGRSGKHLLKKAFADLLPTENVDRPKMGFGVPIGRWFRGPLREALRDALLSEQARARPYFNPQEVGRLVEEHLGDRADHSSKLWNLFMLEMWHREVVEGTREPLAQH